MTDGSQTTMVQRVYRVDPTWTKLVFLMVIAVLFSYGPLWMLAPVPLALGNLLYGRKKIIFSCLIILFLVGVLLPTFMSSYLMVALVCSWPFAFCISEGITKNYRPSRILFLSGASLVTSFVVLLSIFFLFSSTPVKEQITGWVTETVEVVKKNNVQLLEGNSPEIVSLRDLLDNPQMITEMLIDRSFAFLFIFVFLSLWVGLLLVLRNAPLWQGSLTQRYLYTEKDLLDFRLNDQCVYLLILGLVLYVGSDLLGLGRGLEVLGGNILACLAVFYFFQGFGIYLRLLKFLKLRRIVRVLFVAVTLMMAWKVLVVLGVFDLWVDFKKFFTVKRKRRK